MTIKIHAVTEQRSIHLEITAESEAALDLVSKIENLIDDNRLVFDDTCDELDFRITRRRFDRITLEPPY